MSKFRDAFFGQKRKGKPGTAMVPAAKPAELVPLADEKAGRLVKRFLSGKSPETVRAYGRDLDDFGKWDTQPTAGAAIAKLLGMSRGQANEHIHAWRADMIDDGLSPATINRRLSAVRSITSLGRQFEFIEWELEVENVQAQAYRDTAGPGTAAVNEMKRQAVDGAEASPARAARDNAIVRVLHDMALRRAEVARLDWPKHVNLRTGKLTILGKGRTQEELITIPLKTLDALNEWLKHRGKKPGPLFLNFDRAKKNENDEGRLTGNGIYRVVRDLGRKAGVIARPHGLRHTAITTALDKTQGDVRKARKFSRHKRVETLLIYDDNREDLGGEIASQVADTLGD